MIYELGSTEEDSLSEVSGGICIGLDETELENILNNANIEYDKLLIHQKMEIRNQFQRSSESKFEWIFYVIRQM